MSNFESKFPYRVLCLDGGGSKGVYTLGILAQLEKRVGTPLAQYFDLIYGTSTGAIIGSMLALGLSVTKVKEAYFALAPKVMDFWLPSDRSDALEREAYKIFEDRKFDSFLTNIGIVATNNVLYKPLIFKKSSQQVFGSVSTFQPGFGCTIADAVLASAAAYPLFDKRHIQTPSGKIELIDGGFVANNPTLFAIIEALKGGRGRLDLRVLSLGVGHYREPNRNPLHRVLYGLPSVKLVQSQLEASSRTAEIAREFVFGDVPCVRIDDANFGTRFQTDLLEFDADKLDLLFMFGWESYAKHEQKIETQFLV